MSEARELPGRIVVAGDGQVGSIAAIALKRALPTSDVLVIGTPFDPAAVADHAASALPFTNRFHDQIGISEEAMVRHAGASHRLVTRYFGFGGPGHVGVAPSGGALDPALRSAFAREWGGGPRNAATGRTTHSLAEALADAGRFMAPDGQAEGPLAELDYALRWNRPAYRSLLAEAAGQLGVRHQPGIISGVAPDGQGGAAAVNVEGAGAVSADLFIDCTGSRATILSQMAGFERVDWQDALPVRGLIHLAPEGAMLALEDRVSITSAGWLAETAGRDGKATLLAVPEGMDEATILEVLGKIPASAFKLVPARAERSWIGNVIGLGDAAATFEPLGWLNLDLAHRQIALLLELLPGKASNHCERDEYNRRAAMMADRARDVVASHYASPGAVALFGNAMPSNELALALDQFRRRGRMPFFEETPMLAQEWSTLLHALGIPATESAVARAADPAVADHARMLHEARCRAALQVVPLYSQWLSAQLESERAS